MLIGLCGEPTTFPNSLYTLDKVDPYSFGSLANYTCDTGYKMMGNENFVIHECTLSALHQLTWSGPMVRCIGMTASRHAVYFVVTIKVGP